MTSKALLLLDADGVLGLLGEGNGEPTFEAIAGSFPVTIAVASQERLSRLARVFQIVWATSWQRTAAEHLGPLLGLPADLPFLSFDQDLGAADLSYKLPAVQRFVGTRATAWVDDELGEDVMAWADQRQSPTLLIHTDPRYGLLDEHVDRLLAFAARLPGGA